MAAAVKICEKKIKNQRPFFFEGSSNGEQVAPKNHCRHLTVPGACAPIIEFGI